MNYYTEIQLINQSKLNVRLKSHEDVHGWLKVWDNPVIGPGAWYRYTAIDPKGELYGSEGVVTFCDDEARTSFTIRYCCSFGPGGNYCFFTEASPILDVTLRFDNEAPPSNATKDWGKPTVPKDGRPLGVLVYVEQRPIKQSLKILTYNTHLFGGSPITTVAKFLVQKDEERCMAILRNVMNTDADIVCLQEVWSLKFRDDITKEFAKRYPFIYISPDAVTHLPWWAELLSWLPAAIPGAFVPVILANIIAHAVGRENITEWLVSSVDFVKTSGLLLASRIPLDEIEFTPYEKMTDRDDIVARKGVISFTALIPIATPKYSFLPVRIGMTHAPTPFSDAVRTLQDYALPHTKMYKKYADSYCGWIMLGDLNLNSENAESYEKLSEVMAPAVNVVGACISHIDQRYTSWGNMQGNSLSVLLDSTRYPDSPAPQYPKEQIDHVYFCPKPQSMHQPQLIPNSAKVFHDWMIPYEFTAFQKSFTKLDVSDHYPVLTEFKITTRQS